jgi:hypothetical protein
LSNTKVVHFYSGDWHTFAPALTALWDAAFDRGLVSFSQDGAPVLSPRLSDGARSQLLAHPVEPLELSSLHQNYLAYHRNNVFAEE